MLPLTYLTTRGNGFRTVGGKSETPAPTQVLVGVPDTVKPTGRVTVKVKLNEVGMVELPTDNSSIGGVLIAEASTAYAA
ncbi:hypothetical protein [Actinokineospora inagensis]|uniref:hypothetical protein n=1 Tax=Actinokineospora inagensis TaxID=103730 RepID=UPI0003FF13C4|nr:hypothetical protein [Actinokineospora inagensis]